MKKSYCDVCGAPAIEDVYKNASASLPVGKPYFSDPPGKVVQGEVFISDTGIRFRDMNTCGHVIPDLCVRCVVKLLRKAADNLWAAYKKSNKQKI